MTGTAVGLAFAISFLAKANDSAQSSSGPSPASQDVAPEFRQQRCNGGLAGWLLGRAHQRGVPRRMEIVGTAEAGDPHAVPARIRVRRGVQRLMDVAEDVR